MQKVKTTIWSIVANIVFGMLLVSTACAEVSVQTGFDYTSGDYGISEQTQIVYIPVTVRSESDRYMFQVTIPYLQVDAPPTGQTIIGPGGTPIQTSAGGRESNSGLGDVVTSFRYTLLDGVASGLLLDVIGKVKFGTADENDGLGTGENDYSFQIDWAQAWGQLTWFATTGYRTYGDPSGVEFDDVFFGSLGGAYKLAQDTSGGLVYDFRENITPGTDARRELTLFATRKIGKKKKIQGYLVRGLSDSSPDWGVGVLFTAGFR